MAKQFIIMHPDGNITEVNGNASDAKIQAETLAKNNIGETFRVYKGDKDYTVDFNDIPVDETNV